MVSSRDHSTDEQDHVACNAGLLEGIPVTGTSVTMDEIVETIRSSRGPLGEERLDVPLVTGDVRLAAADGPECEMRVLR